MTQIESRSFKRSIRLGFAGFLKGIYDPKTNKIFDRKPIDFFFCCIFYILYYGFLFLITAIIYYIVRIMIVDKRPNLGPGSTVILAGFPGLVPLTDSTNIASYDCNYPNTYQTRENELRAALDNYRRTKYNKSCSAGGNHGGFCDFDMNLLGDCKNSLFGLNTNEPCVYFRLNKIYNFDPPGANGSQYISIKCFTNYKNTTVKIYPPKGLLRDSLPYNGKNLPPVVAIRTSIRNGESTTVSCRLSPNLIDLPMYSKPDINIGSINFEIGPALNTSPCNG